MFIHKLICKDEDLLILIGLCMAEGVAILAIFGILKDAIG